MQQSKLETNYQAGLIKRIEELFPGCIILKNDTSYRQGISDLVVFYYNMYAMLEVKAYEGAPEQPNQDYYVELFDNWSFAAFIYPENEREVLRELQSAFSPRRKTRVSKS